MAGNFFFEKCCFSIGFNNFFGGWAGWLAGLAGLLSLAGWARAAKVARLATLAGLAGWAEIRHRTPSRSEPKPHNA